LVPEIVKLLKAQGRDDIVVIVGGVIPETDYDFLQKSGVSQVFGPGTKIPDAAYKVVEEVEKKMK
jgi:methylmalonyl-CoA mutase